jgi:hypothetical protein
VLHCTEVYKSQPGTFHLTRTLSSSVGVGRAERTLLSRCVPLSSRGHLDESLRLPATAYPGPRLSFAVRDAQAAPRGWAASGALLVVPTGPGGETLGKAALGGSDSEDG